MFDFIDILYVTRTHGQRIKSSKNKSSLQSTKHIYLADWNKNPIAEITKDRVAKRHTQLGIKSEAQANLAMCFLRALFNFASGQYEDSKGQTLIADNPVKRLSQTRE